MLRFLIPAALLAAALAAGGASGLAFIDLPALAITIGGALGVVFLSYPLERLRDLATLLRASLTSAKIEAVEHRGAELKRLARLYRMHGSRGLEAQEKTIADPFLRTAVASLVDLDTAEEMRERMESAAEEIAGRYRAAHQILLTLGRLFPAFGLIGTLIGLVSLLRHMAVTEPEALSASFGLAIMTTLYGVVLANAVVLPLAAKLQTAADERTAALRIVSDWGVALARGAGASAVARRLGAVSSSSAAAPAQTAPARSWRVASSER
jgi:chemotaxis protein MotA